MLSNNNEAIKYAVGRGYHFDCQDRLIGPYGKQIKLAYDKNGYPRITVKPKGFKSPIPIRIHRLKAYFLFGDKIFEKGLEVRHLNGNTRDYSDKNIVLGTKTENSFDRPVQERISHALKAAKMTRKLSENDVKEIIMKHHLGRSLRQLSKEYGASKSTMSYVINKKTYRTFTMVPSSSGQG